MSPLQGIAVGFGSVVVLWLAVLLVWVLLDQRRDRSNLGRERSSGHRRP